MLRSDVHLFEQCDINRSKGIQSGLVRLTQSSLLSERPWSLVAGVVLNCDELPKLESCLPCSSGPFGFRLKKFLKRPVVFFLLGLKPGPEDACESG